MKFVVEKIRVLFPDVERSAEHYTTHRIKRGDKYVGKITRTRKPGKSEYFNIRFCVYKKHKDPTDKIPWTWIEMTPNFATAYDTAMYINDPDTWPIIKDWKLFEYDKN